MAKKRATQTKVLESCFIASWRAVLGSLAALVMPEILPSSVFKPVEIIIALPRPRVTTVPVKSMFVCSGILVSAGSTAEGSLTTGNDSPVKEDSSTSKPKASKSLASAGTRCPTFKSKMSPGTKNDVCTSTADHFGAPTQSAAPIAEALRLSV